MANKITVGIDIGTFEIKVIVSENSGDRNSLPRIIGTGQSESKGMRHGYILNQNDVVRSIRKSVRLAERASNFKIDKAFVSIGGIGLSSTRSTGHVIISRADSEITELDLEKVANEAQDKIAPAEILNRKIIHAIPINYKIDDREVAGDPVGMKGVKLEVEMLFITSLVPHLNDLIEAVESAGIEIIDATAAPLAASTVTLSKNERIAGCVLVNIGSETASMVVYEDDLPVLVEVFPIGSNDITNDIALGLKISLDDAEKIKKGRDKNDVPASVPRKKLDEIVIARLSDIFDLVNEKLKSINKSGLLPAGIILTGGGSGVLDIEDLARASLQLPSKIAKISTDTTSRSNSRENIRIKDSSWAVAYGLCVVGFNNDNYNMPNKRSKNLFFKNIISWFQKFLP